MANNNSNKQGSKTTVTAIRDGQIVQVELPPADPSAAFCPDCLHLKADCVCDSRD